MRESDREACEPIEDDYPPVIDRETFDRFQSPKSSKAPRHGRHSRKELKNVLGGLATCPLCGSTMARVTKNVAKS